MSADSTLDALGLRGALPCPGWVVLDAARDHRFTGELIAEANDTFRVYFDRGRIYVAERATDPPLGTRLVDAGALNAAQLEYGTLRIGEIRHLGRLFDRVPSVNRDGVLVLNQLMTEQCVRSLAARAVSSVTATPYRHHESGMHRWEIHEPSGGASTTGEVPEMALPAPPPDSRPIIADEPPAEAPATRADTSGATDAPRPPADVWGTTDRPRSTTDVPGGTDAPRSTPETTTPTEPRSAERPGPPRRAAAESDLAGDLFLDDVVEWNEPSLLVAAAHAPGTRTARRAPRDLFADTTSGGDWADDLGPEGVGDAPGEPSATSSKLAPVPVRPVDHFELVWPSGETVDLAESPPPADDLDRRSPTARVGAAGPTSTDADEPAADSPHEPTTPSDSPASTEPDETTTLAVRRAVATIDTGSLAARRRLAATPTDAPAPPGRLMVGRDHNSWRATSDRPATSVFDEVPITEDEEPTTPAPAPTSEPTAEHHGRANALRRLIDSLRRE